MPALRDVDPAHGGLEEASGKYEVGQTPVICSIVLHLHDPSGVSFSEGRGIEV